MFLWGCLRELNRALEDKRGKKKRGEKETAFLARHSISNFVYLLKNISNFFLYQKYIKLCFYFARVT